MSNNEIPDYVKRKFATLKLNCDLIYKRASIYLGMIDRIVNGKLFSLPKAKLDEAVRTTYEYVKERYIDETCDTYSDVDVLCNDNPVYIDFFSKLDLPVWQHVLFNALFPTNDTITNTPCWERHTHIRPNNERISDIVKENIPQYLYKYRKVSEHSLENLESDTIWMSNPTSFNDLFDSILCEGIPSLEEYIEHNSKILKNARLANERKDYRQLINFIELHKKGFSSFNGEITLDMLHCCRLVYSMWFRSLEIQKIWVGCLCERNDSNLMWSHYADSHKGYCVAYLGSDLYRHPRIGECIYPVFYSDLRIPAWLEYDIVYYELFAALHKTTDWGYEKEWRIVLSPYESKTAFNQSLAKPQAIYLGERMEKADKERVMSIGRKKNIPCFQSIRDDRERKIDFIPC